MQLIAERVSLTVEIQDRSETRDAERDIGRPLPPCPAEGVADDDRYRNPRMGDDSLAAANLAEEQPDEDALVCGDDEEAKALALDLAEKITSGRALDAGPLASARALEGLTAVIVNLNKRYRGHAGLRITGLG